jgi:diguanylate cyclase (GGDEF)-like protein
MSGEQRGRLSTREVLRLLPVLGPVTLGGAAALAYAVARLAADPPSGKTFAAVGVLAAAGALAEAAPVPVAYFPAGTISVSAIFIVGAGMLHGVVAAVVTGFLSRAVVEAARRRPLSKRLFNSGLYALSGLAAGLGAAGAGRVGGVSGLLAGAAAGSAAFFVVNIPLVVAIVARSTRQAFVPMLRVWVRWTAVSFAVMASVALMLATLWERSPVLAAALAGPLVATALHQRSMRDALRAMRLALTDPLTSLGNHRHFHDRLRRQLELAAANGGPFALCLLDLDDFKRVNDTFGHLAGDDVLRRVAACVRGGGEAFRVGGDEFALLLSRADARHAEAVAKRVLERLAAIDGGEVPITFSAGLACYPDHATELTELLRLADVALYLAKREGKNRLRSAEPARPPAVALETQSA